MVKAPGADSLGEGLGLDVSAQWLSPTFVRMFYSTEYTRRDWPVQPHHPGRFNQLRPHFMFEDE
jgi:hypothetical protein